MKERRAYVKELLENNNYVLINYKETEYEYSDLLVIEVTFKEVNALNYKGFLLYEKIEIKDKHEYFKSIINMKLKKDL